MICFGAWSDFLVGILFGCRQIWLVLRDRQGGGRGVLLGGRNQTLPASVVALLPFPPFASTRLTRTDLHLICLWRDGTITSRRTHTQLREIKHLFDVSVQPTAGSVGLVGWLGRAGRYGRGVEGDALKRPDWGIPVGIFSGSQTVDPVELRRQPPTLASMPFAPCRPHPAAGEKGCDGCTAWSLA